MPFTKLTKTGLALTLALTGTLFMPVTAAGQETEATALLTLRNEALERDIVQVSDNVWTAVGYSPANISMIVGDDGLIFVDTGMAPNRARDPQNDVRDEGRALRQKHRKGRCGRIRYCRVPR